jgi:hypothetical protein
MAADKGKKVRAAPRSTWCSRYVGQRGPTQAMGQRHGSTACAQHVACVTPGCCAATACGSACPNVRCRPATAAPLLARMRGACAPNHGPHCLQLPFYLPLCGSQVEKNFMVDFLMWVLLCPWPCRWEPRMC